MSYCLSFCVFLFLCNFLSTSSMPISTRNFPLHSIHQLFYFLTSKITNVLFHLNNLILHILYILCIPLYFNRPNRALNQSYGKLLTLMLYQLPTLPSHLVLLLMVLPKTPTLVVVVLLLLLHLYLKSQMSQSALTPPTLMPMVISPPRLVKFN